MLHDLMGSQLEEQLISDLGGIVSAETGRPEALDDHIWNAGSQ